MIMSVNKNDDGKQAAILWGLLIIVFMAFLLYMIYVSKQHPFIAAFTAAQPASLVIIGGIMPLTDTQEKLARIAAEQAAQYILDKAMPYMVKRQEAERNFWRRIWNATKHAAGIFRKEVDEAMKE